MNPLNIKQPAMETPVSPSPPKTRTFETYNKRFGKDAFHIACEHGEFAIANEIINSGLPISELYLNRTPLISACFYTTAGRLASMAYIHGIVLTIINAKNPDGSPRFDLGYASGPIGTNDLVPAYCNTALMSIFVLHNPDIAYAILNTGRGNVGYVNPDGTTALIRACTFSGCEKLVLAILKTGESKPEQIKKGGETALYYACKLDWYDTVKTILDTALCDDHIHLQLKYSTKKGNSAYDCAKRNSTIYAIHDYLAWKRRKYAVVYSSDLF